MPPPPPPHPDDQIEEVDMDCQDREDLAQRGPSPPPEMDWQPVDDMDAESVASVISARSHDRMANLIMICQSPGTRGRRRQKYEK
jgi:hypothetical protein